MKWKNRELRLLARQQEWDTLSGNKTSYGKDNKLDTRRPGSMRK